MRGINTLRGPGERPRDCTARLWTGSEGKVDQSGCLELIGHEKFCVSCCAIPPCARFPAGAVASGSMDSSIVIWDNAEPAITLLGHTEQVPLCCLLLNGLVQRSFLLFRLTAFLLQYWMALLCW